MKSIRLFSLGWDKWHHEVSTRNIYIEIRLILKHNLRLIFQSFPSASPQVVSYLKNIFLRHTEVFGISAFPWSSVFLCLPPTTSYTHRSRQGNVAVMAVCYSICNQSLGYSLEAWFILLKIWSFHKDQCHSFGSWKLHFSLHLCNYNILKKKDTNHCLVQFDTLGKV